MLFFSRKRKRLILVLKKTIVIFDHYIMLYALHPSKPLFSSVESHVQLCIFIYMYIFCCCFSLYIFIDCINLSFQVLFDFSSCVISSHIIRVLMRFIAPTFHRPLNLIFHQTMNDIVQNV